MLKYLEISFNRMARVGSLMSLIGSRLSSPGRQSAGVSITRETGASCHPLGVLAVSVSQAKRGIVGASFCHDWEIWSLNWNHKTKFISINWKMN